MKTVSLAQAVIAEEAVLPARVHVLVALPGRVRVSGVRRRSRRRPDASAFVASSRQVRHASLRTTATVAILPPRRDRTRCPNALERARGALPETLRTPPDRTEHPSGHNNFMLDNAVMTTYLEKKQISSVRGL
jgi:hypothetical protein